MDNLKNLPIKKEMLKNFQKTVNGITFIAGDTKKLVIAAANGDIKSYCLYLQQYKLKRSRDYSIILLIFSPLIVVAGALYKCIENSQKAPPNSFYEKIYTLEKNILNDNRVYFDELCNYIGEGLGNEIEEILKNKLKPYREMLRLLSGNKYGNLEDVFMKRVRLISPWGVVNKKYIKNNLIPCIQNTFGARSSSKIKSGLNVSHPTPTGTNVELNQVGSQKKVSPTTSSLSEETKEQIKHISESLRCKRRLLLEHKNTNETLCENTYEELKTLLESDSEGAEDVSDLLEDKYFEWKNRLTRPPYNTIQDGSRFENYALMNLAHSLRLAKAENYDASNPKNNELIVGNAPIDETMLETIDDDTDEHKKTINQRLGKVIVEDEDILRSAQKHFDELDLANKRFGFLNAGDPYDPNGFLPNHGSALEEYLSMNTTLCRDLSHKEFRRVNETSESAFYTERKKAFPPIVDFPKWSAQDGKRYYDKKGAWDRLTGAGRDFYHSRGLMSKNVYLTRGLGDCSVYYTKDTSYPWKCPEKQFDNFEVDRTSGLGSKSFYILSIAGLEDRSKTLLTDGGDGHTAEEYQQKWHEITMKQCEFVLRAFIKEQVQVLFLCAFGAGCFGGRASIVARCFRELLIRRGYINYFDKVVFPIGYDSNNFRDFQTAFSS